MKKYFRKIILILLIFSIFTFSAAPANAGYWGESWMSTLFKQMMERIQVMIHGFIMGSMKQAAISSISSSLRGAVSGNGGPSGSQNGSKFVTNWEEALLAHPQETTNKKMDDFFTEFTRGKMSGSYIGNSQAEYLTGQAQQWLSDNIPVSTIDQYISDTTDNLITNNGYKAFVAMVGNPANNPFGVTLIASKQKQSIQENETRVQETKLIANQGFISTESGGSVVTPGIITKDILSKSEQISFETIASANNIPEIVTSLVTRMASSAIKQGIGKAQKYAMDKVNQNKSLSRGINAVNNPGAAFRSRY